MKIEKFIELNLKERKELLEISWHRPHEDSPHLVIDKLVQLKGGGIVDGIPLDHNYGERGYLLCYYNELVEQISDEYKEGKVETPFIGVSLTKERDGVPNNNTVDIPLTYISRIILLTRKY